MYIVSEIIWVFTSDLLITIKEKIKSQRKGQNFKRRKYPVTYFVWKIDKLRTSKKISIREYRLFILILFKSINLLLYLLKINDLFLNLKKKECIVS